MDNDNKESKPVYDEEGFKRSLDEYDNCHDCSRCKAYLAKFNHYEGLAKEQCEIIEDLESAYQKNYNEAKDKEFYKEDPARKEAFLKQQEEVRKQEGREEEILSLVLEARRQYVYGICEIPHGVVSERKIMVEILEKSGCNPKAIEVMKEHSKRCKSCLQKIIDAGITNTEDEWKIKRSYDMGWGDVVEHTE